MEPVSPKDVRSRSRVPRLAMACVGLAVSMGLLLTLNESIAAEAANRGKPDQFAFAQGAGPAPGDAAKGDAAPGGPQMVGEAPKGPWKPLAPDEQSKAVKDLDAFGEDAQQRMGVKLIRHETSYFLFYSDLNAAEARKWADLLDKMYARLAELFGTGKTTVWRGKALVFVFSKERDYIRFQGLMHNTNAAGTAGMCHTFGSGDVHIAFFRQPDEKAFAHVLVHESVHGFLHRYKTPVRIPSWVNEGLAETIAAELVPPPPPPKGVGAPAPRDEEDIVMVAGRKAVEGHGKSLGGMLDAAPIKDWHYPVSHALTKFMIRGNRRGYVNFIVGIKEGMPWEDALKEKFKLSRVALVKEFGGAVKVTGLKQ